MEHRAILTTLPAACRAARADPLYVRRTARAMRRLDRWGAELDRLGKVRRRWTQIIDSKPEPVDIGRRECSARRSPLRVPADRCWRQLDAGRAAHVERYRCQGAEMREMLASREAVMLLPPKTSGASKYSFSTPDAVEEECRTSVPRSTRSRRVVEPFLVRAVAREHQSSAR